jgi:hypothetical protein
VSLQNGIDAAGRIGNVIGMEHVIRSARGHPPGLTVPADCAWRAGRRPVKTCRFHRGSF